MSHFRTIDGGTPYLLPLSVDEWLPANHLAHFVVEVVDQLDLSALTGAYRGGGLGRVSPGDAAGVADVRLYATGTYSSRRIERASYDSLAFRYIAANSHPDHDTLCAFRNRFAGEIESLFVQVLRVRRLCQTPEVANKLVGGQNLLPAGPLDTGYAAIWSGKPVAEVLL